MVREGRSVPMATKRVRGRKGSSRSAAGRKALRRVRMKTPSSATRPGHRREAADEVSSTIAWQRAFSLTTEETETSLKNGENASLLEDYFGTEQYAELRRLA